MKNKGYINLLKELKWIISEGDNIIYLPSFYQLHKFNNDLIKTKIQNIGFEEIYPESLINELSIENYAFFYQNKDDCNFIKIIYKSNQEEQAKHKMFDILSNVEKYFQEYGALPCLSGKILDLNGNIDFGIFTNLENNYVQILNINYQDLKIESHFCNSLIDLVLLEHSDAEGFSIPPRMAPIQVCFLVDNNISLKELKIINTYKNELESQNVRVSIDTSNSVMKEKIIKKTKEGIPLLIEVYQKSIKKDIFNLILRFNKEKKKISKAEFVLIPNILEDIQRQMYQVKLKRHINNLPQSIPCCMNQNCVEKISDSNYILLIPFMQKTNVSNCIICGENNRKKIYKIKKN